MEVADILVEHFQWTVESGPRAAGGGMGVADSVDVGTCFMESGVYEVACFVGRASLPRSEEH